MRKQKMPNLNFDTNSIEIKEDIDYSPMPVGDYTVTIIDSEIKQTRKGDGDYINFTFQVAQGEKANRLLWTIANINNPSSEATRIGRETVAKIAKAVGVASPQDTAQLHNIPLVVSVGIKENTYNGETKNVNYIKGYKSLGKTANQFTNAPAPRAGDDVPNDGAAPWS